MITNLIFLSICLNMIIVFAWLSFQNPEFRGSLKDIFISFYWKITQISQTNNEPTNEINGCQAEAGGENRPADEIQDSNLFDAKAQLFIMSCFLPRPSSSNVFCICVH